MSNKPIWLAVLLVLLCTKVTARAAEKIQLRQLVQLNSWIDKQDTIAIGEEQILNIEVTTLGEFASKTKIQWFEVDQAVVIGQSKFPKYSREIVIDGQTASKQLWPIKLYPIKPGKYTVPAVGVELSVTYDQQLIKGRLKTQAETFYANKPSVHMNENNFWLTANNVELNQEWTITRLSGTNDNTDDGADYDIEEQSTATTIETFNVGDAIERKVTLTGYNTSSMLFPTFLSKLHYRKLNLKAYAGPDESFDIDEEQGSYGEHIETMTMMIDNAGEFAIPAISLYWWLPEEQRMEIVSLEGKSIVVEHTPASYLQAHWKTILAWFLAFISVLFFSYKLWLKLKYLLQHGKMPIWYQFYHAIFNRKLPLAESILYNKHFKDKDSLTLEKTNLEGKAMQAWDKSRTEFQQQRYQPTRSANMHAIKRRLVILWRI